jgi:hypothetical protein
MKNKLEIKNIGTKIIIRIVVAIFLMCICVYLYMFNFSAKTKVMNAEAAVNSVNIGTENSTDIEETQSIKDINAQVQDLVEKVSKLTKLPTDDTPQIFEVTDPTQLVGKKAFFKDSQKGDKVLVYVKSAQAIIYREVTNKIINVGPVSFDNINKK